MSLSNLPNTTIAGIREWLIATFTAADFPSAAVNAKWLLEHVTGRTTLELLTAGTTTLTAAERAHLTNLVQRCLAHEPLQYVVGYTEFYGRRFTVTPDALIPRPETEQLVQYALNLGSMHETVLDIGTGSGVIAITLALERPNWTVFASDINAAALHLAQQNAATLGADVTWFNSDLLANVPVDQVTLIVANLPYLPADDVHRVSPDVRHEPASALYSGATGMDHVTRLFTELQAFPGTRDVLLELDPRNVSQAAAAARSCGFHAPAVLPDLARRDRFLMFSQKA